MAEKDAGGGEEVLHPGREKTGRFRKDIQVRFGEIL